MVAVGVEILLRVVNSHASVDGGRQGRVLHDRYTLVGAVRVLEEHDGSPVVREVLGEGAGGAGSLLSDVTLHGDVEGISTDDLVEMSRGDDVGLDEWVKALNS